MYSIKLPPTLDPEAGPGARKEALARLRDYFAPLVLSPKGQSLRLGGYTGGQWDTFDPSLTRASSANVFTSDDIVACSLLSVEIQGGAALQLLTRPEFELLLVRIGGDADLADLATLDCAKFRAVRALYARIVQIPHVGETRATKLLARKRPRLVPIMDSVVKEHVFDGAPMQWAALHAALRADDQRL